MIPVANVPLDSGNGPGPLRAATRDLSESSSSFSSAMDQAAASPAPAASAPGTPGAPGANSPDPKPAAASAPRATPGRSVINDPQQAASTASAAPQGAGGSTPANLLASLAAGKGAARRAAVTASPSDEDVPAQTAAGANAHATLRSPPEVGPERSGSMRTDAGTASAADADKAMAPQVNPVTPGAGTNPAVDAIAAQALTQSLQNSAASTAVAKGTDAATGSSLSTLTAAAGPGVAQEKAGTPRGATERGTVTEQGAGGPLDTSTNDAPGAAGGAAFDAQLASATESGSLGASSRMGNAALAFSAKTSEGAQAIAGAPNPAAATGLPDPAQSLASTLQSLHGGAASGAGSASHASVQLATPFGQSGFGQDVAQQILVLARNGKQSAELSLHPADMGPVNVSIQMSGMQASLLISAGHEATRAALQQALPQLHQLFQNSGLQLTGAHVGDGAPRNPEQPPPRGYTGSGRGAASTVPATAASAPLAAASASGLRLVDTFA